MLFYIAVSKKTDDQRSVQSTFPTKQRAFNILTTSYIEIYVALYRGDTLSPEDLFLDNYFEAMQKYVRDDKTYCYV